MVKVVILLSAVWFTIEFLIDSEDRRTPSLNVENSLDLKFKTPHSLELKYKNVDGDMDGGGDGGDGGGVDDNENSIDNINENVDKFFNNEPIIYKNSANSANQKNDSVVNNVILSNFNNNDNLNSNKNFNDDASISNIFGKSKRLNPHQRLDMNSVRKPPAEDNGKC